MTPATDARIITTLLRHLAVPLVLVLMLAAAAGLLQRDPSAGTVEATAAAATATTRPTLVPARQAAPRAVEQVPVATPSVTATPVTPPAAPSPTPTPTETRTHEPSRSEDRASDIRTIRVRYVATSQDMQQKLDRCDGPVQVNWPGHTTEIAQHDYCGGAWFNTVAKGQLIRVSGGTMGGLWVVNGNRRTVSKGAPVSSLDGLGGLVLQTCVGSKMVLVGLSRA